MESLVKEEMNSLGAVSAQVVSKDVLLGAHIGEGQGGVPQGHLVVDIKGNSSCDLTKLTELD